jgi:hypothetical protein
MAYNRGVRYQWDPDKETANREKHGIGFDEVRELFEGDTDYLEIFDEEHSIVEERFIAVGPIARGVVLVVWTEPGEDVVRIISARLATPRERELFHRYMEERK